MGSTLFLPSMLWQIILFGLTYILLYFLVFCVNLPIHFYKEPIKLNTMLTKTKLKDHIEKFPEEFSIDELIDRLILIEKIEKGNLQSEKGKVISETELDKEIIKWFE